MRMPVQSSETRGQSITGRFLSALLLACLLSACGTTTSSQLWPSFLNDGMLALSRPVPPSESPEAIEKILSSGTWGFAPGLIAALQDNQKEWISIDRNQGLIQLMKGTSVLERESAEGLQSLKPGSFSVQHKQRNPVWYASDEYFQQRGMSVPGPGDKARFLRGALGDFALFLDKNTPIHSGPVWSSEVGGARLEENSISKIYYSIDPGSTVVVR